MLTEKQAAAYDLICNAKEGISKIEGYAGTGKSFVLSKAAQELGKKCLVLTPTNKSAQVLRDKGISASTLHSILYSPRNTLKFKKNDGKMEYHKDADGNFILDDHGEKIPVIESEELAFDFVANPEELKNKIAIIDEASMLKEQELADITSVFDKVVLIGDGMQLPPIKSKDVLQKQRLIFSLMKCIVLPKKIQSSIWQLTFAREAEISNNLKMVSICWLLTSSMRKL